MKPKTLHNSDIKIFGDEELWVLICKASSESEGWMKSTKAMQLPRGCLIQVTTQQRNLDGSYSVAEALTYAPDVSIMGDDSGIKKLL